MTPAPASGVVNFFAFAVNNIEVTSTLLDLVAALESSAVVLSDGLSEFFASWALAVSIRAANIALVAAPVESLVYLADGVEVSHPAACAEEATRFANASIGRLGLLEWNASRTAASRATRRTTRGTTADSDVLLTILINSAAITAVARATDVRDPGAGIASDELIVLDSFTFAVRSNN